MDAADGIGGSEIGRRRGGLRYALAGLEAGVAGALVLIAWLMLASLFTGRSAWLTPNLLATTFYGGSVYRSHFLRASWTGVALLFALYGLMGVLWGMIWREKRIRGLTFLGALAGITAYFLLFDLLFHFVNPLIAVYAPVRQLEIGSVLWGMVLARSPRYARRIAESNSPAIPRSAAAEPQDTAPAVKSGEVIQ